LAEHLGISDPVMILFFGIYVRVAKPFIAAAMKPKPQTRSEAA
jgi:hypothetical protein